MVSKWCRILSIHSSCPCLRPRLEHCSELSPKCLGSSTSGERERFPRANKMRRSNEMRSVGARSSQHVRAAWQVAFQILLELLGSLDPVAHAITASPTNESLQWRYLLCAMFGSHAQVRTEGGLVLNRMLRTVHFSERKPWPLELCWLALHPPKCRRFVAAPLDIELNSTTLHQRAWQGNPSRYVFPWHLQNWWVGKPAKKSPPQGSPA